MNRRRMRVAGVPADFCVPRNWPTPTDRWVRANAFWTPPPSWTPQPGVPQAPADWTFWRPNPLWHRSKSVHDGRLAAWSRMAVLLLVVWLMALAATALQVAGRLPAVMLPVEVLYPTGLAAAVLSLFCVVVYLVGHQRATTALVREYSIIAAAERQKRLTAEYQHYLRDGS